jgi:hypothetical protein
MLRLLASVLVVIDDIEIVYVAVGIILLTHINRANICLFNMRTITSISHLYSHLYSKDNGIMEINQKAKPHSWAYYSLNHLCGNCFKICGKNKKESRSEICLPSLLQLLLSSHDMLTPFLQKSKNEIKGVIFLAQRNTQEAASYHPAYHK